MEPWKGSVDRPESVEANVTPPMHYVLCIDNGTYQISDNEFYLFFMTVDGVVRNAIKGCAKLPIWYFSCRPDSINAGLQIFRIGRSFPKFD